MNSQKKAVLSQRKLKLGKFPFIQKQKKIKIFQLHNNKNSQQKNYHQNTKIRKIIKNKYRIKTNLFLKSQHHKFIILHMINRFIRINFIQINNY